MARARLPRRVRTSTNSTSLHGETVLLTLRLPEAPAAGFGYPPGHDRAAVRTAEFAEGRAHLFPSGVDAAAVFLDLHPATPGAGSPVPGYAAYTAGALLGLALHRLFASASLPVDDGPQGIEARLPALWCPGGETMVTRLFGPLGYAVKAVPLPLHPEQPRVGTSPFYSVALSGRQRPREALSHLCVLLPLFDDRRRGMSDGDAEELWREGRAWLATHPERDVLASRLLRRAPRSRVHDRRHDAVLAALRESGARRVLDLGCGPGTLLHRLAQEPQFDEVVGVEVAPDELAQAAAGLDPGGRGRVLHGSLAYRDPRLAGFDAAALIEVVEHLDPPQLAALQGAVWETARPATVVVTTPNAEYNPLFQNQGGGRLRHPDHRFEWTRAEFRAWAQAVAARHGYTVRFGAAGPQDARVGPLTQMAVFQRVAGAPRPADEAAGADDAPPSADAGIHLQDVAGERTISTRLGGGVHVTAHEAAAALEAMSRFAVDPRWLVYLPPTTPAAVAAGEGDALEHPLAALAYYRARAVARVSLQELRTGTRVAAVVCRDAATARRRFRVARGETGSVYSAAGRPFFATRAAEEEFLARVRGALGGGGVWERLATDWVALEGVIGPGVPVMPEVNPRLRPPPALYGAVAVAARTTLAAAEAALAHAVAAGVDAAALLHRTRRRAALVTSYTAGCRRTVTFCRTPAELRLTPIRLLAAEGAVYAERDARWQRERLTPAAQAAPETLTEAGLKIIDPRDPAGEAAALAWWDGVMAKGGAGIVVRPLGRVPGGKARATAPALKCRSEDALLLEHGPEHGLPEHRERLRRQGMDAAAGRAEREWALSVEALDRFVAGESTARVHQCVFGALALKLGSGT